MAFAKASKLQPWSEIILNNLLTTPDFNSRGSWFLKLSFPFLYLFDLKNMGFNSLVRCQSNNGRRLNVSGQLIPPS